MFTFPFSVPEDLSTLDRDSLATLLGQVREFASGLVGDGPVTPEILEGLRASNELASSVVGLIGEIDSRNDEAAQLIASLSTVGDGMEVGQTTTEPAAPAPNEPAAEPGAEPAAVVAARGAAARRPSVRDVAGRNTTAPQLPADADRRRFVTMRAAANVPTFAAGAQLETFADAANALAAQIANYPVDPGTTRPVATDSRKIIVNVDGGKRYPMENFTRHGAVQFVRQFPEDLTVTDGVRGLQIAEHAASERRLPGGSLVRSAQMAVQQGRSLTAAAGWCAPSETIWDLVELETLDGILDMPELSTSRGGWQIPANGGPDFSTIWTGLGTTHRTEAQVIAESPAKTCWDIPCPSFTDVRLGVDYFCLTGSLLQRRGYPEVVQRFSRGAMTGLAHKINAGLIGAIVTIAGAANVIPPCAVGEDALSSLLAAVEIATVDAKYRNRLGMNSTLEVVLPWWVLAQLRAAASRRTGCDMTSINDQMIMDLFAIRGAVPRFVYDWQDAYTAAVMGPGGAFASLALPQTVNFLVYPAGTFVKAVQPVVNLDTVYDSTQLGTNQYTAMFVEDGWAVLQMQPYVRQYTATVDPCSDLGCCHS